MQFIDLQAQYSHLKSRIDQRISGVLNHGKYIMGPEVEEFEEALGNYVGVKHVVSCANGTDALQLSLMALGIGPGDAVFCPTFTFFASAEVISLVGATPIFVDVDKDTFNISAVDLENQILKVQKNSGLIPKAIIAVDLFGLPANYNELKSVTDKYSLKLIEDSAQGFGGKINAQRAGSFGDIATTSFFPAKPLGCYGDGGAVFTNCDEYAEILRSLRVHGKGQHKYDNVRIGLNSRLDTIQAAILLEKLAVFDVELERRNEIAKAYSRCSSQFTPPIVPNGFSSSWAQYTLRSAKRAEIMQRLKEKNIPSMVYYETCMHQQTAFKSQRRVDDHFPIAEELCQTVFSLPMHGYMSDENLDMVCATISELK